MILLDSSLIVSYAIKTDYNHAKADKVMQGVLANAYGRPVLSDFIFDECVTVIFAKSKNLVLATKVGENLRGSVEILEVNRAVFEDSWSLFKNQKDTKLSFTDCTSVSMMEKRDIRNIATFDKEFMKIKGVTVIRA